MSRVAEALRRHRLALGAPDASNADLMDITKSSWSTTEVPWQLGDAASNDPRLGRVETPSQAAVNESVNANRVWAGAPSFGGASHDQLSRLVHRMLHESVPNTRLRSVLFTSIGSEMSNGVCAATAEVLASQTAASVCLVAADCRAAAEPGPFDLGGAPGISDVLLQKVSLRACLAKVAANLWVLPPGTTRDEAANGLLGEQMRGHFREVLETFDYVLVDTAPVNMHSDATAWARLVDGVVLVIGANATRRQAARRIVEELRAVDANVLGAILTNRDFPIPETVYRLL